MNWPDLNDEKTYTREANETSWSATVIIVAMLFTVWGALLVNVPELKDTATINLFMTLAAMTLALVAYVSSAISQHVVYPIGVYPFPKLKDMPLMLLVGIAYGLIYAYISGGVVNVAKTLDISPPFLSLPPLFLFLFYVFGAPGSEEILFRGTILPILLRMGTNTNRPRLKIIGFVSMLLVDVLAWDIAHVYTFGGSMAYLESAFLFGIGLVILTVFFRSAGPAIFAHMTYNGYLMWNIVKPPSIYLFFLVMGALILLGAYFVDQIKDSTKKNSWLNF